MLADHKVATHTEGPQGPRDEEKLATVLVDPAFEDGGDQHLRAALERWRAEKIAKGDHDVVNGIDMNEIEKLVLPDKRWISARTGLAVVLAILLLLILGLGLGFGLSATHSNGSNDDGKDQHMSMSASDFLEQNAIFQTKYIEAEESSLGHDDDVILILHEVESQTGSRRLSNGYELEFFGSGETVTLQFRLVLDQKSPEMKAYGVGIRFTGSSRSTIRLFQINDVASKTGQLKFTLPMACPNEQSGSCNKISVSVFPILMNETTNKMFRPTDPGQQDFGWLCSRPKLPSPNCADSDLCKSLITSCSTNNIERLEQCLQQFSLDQKIREILKEPKSIDCLGMSVLETSVVSQCGNLLGMTLNGARQQEKIVADQKSGEVCSADRTQCIDEGLACDSFVISRMRILYAEDTQTLAPTHSIVLTSVPSTSPTSSRPPTSSPTRLPTSPTSTTFSPGLSSSPTSVTSKPTNLPTLKPTIATFSPTRTHSPTIPAPTAPCNRNCTCPMVDPCCCRDGFCAPETCPDSLV